MQTDNIPTAKAVTVINAPIEAIISLYQDINNVRNWNVKLKNITVLHTAGNFRLIKSQIKSRWPMDDRELLCVTNTVTENNGNLVYLLEKSVELPNQPVERKHVRANLMMSGFILEKSDETRTRVTYIHQFDPLANVPNAIKEKMQIKSASGKLNYAKTRLG